MASNGYDSNCQVEIIIFRWNFLRTKCSRFEFILFNLGSKIYDDTLAFHFRKNERRFAGNLATILLRRVITAAFYNKCINLKGETTRRGYEMDWIILLFYELQTDKNNLLH